MANVAGPPPPAEPPGLPDYVLNPNATLGDASANWRYGKAPDYTNTRQVYEESALLLQPKSHIHQLTPMQQKLKTTPRAPFQISSKTLSKTGR
jgi:hypothetical protein